MCSVAVGCGGKDGVDADKDDRTQTVGTGITIDVAWCATASLSPDKGGGVRARAVNQKGGKERSGGQSMCTCVVESEISRY